MPYEQLEGQEEVYRIGNASNHYQGNYKKVLCVCSGGLLRSPTAAVVLAKEPFNYNTRSCGINAEYALTKIDHVLLCWADEIVCMEYEHKKAIETLQRSISFLSKAPIICLDIPDIYAYRDEQLVALITERYQQRTRDSHTSSAA
jgi:predicted protein tyrosine phosphatase